MQAGLVINMYSLEQIQKGFRNRELIIVELNKKLNHLRYGAQYNPAGIDIFDEDWDNLLILDACRYDMFLEVADLPGKTESRISRGSTSPEFIRGNFMNKSLQDVVYISANAWYAKLEDELNSKLHAFELVERDAFNGLTSRPETVSEAARNAINRYPNKRLIVHFMQPHQPFLGPTGEELNHEPGMLATVKASNATEETIRQAYRENLELALKEVQSLFTDLKGRSVVTADHGEIFGQQIGPIPGRMWGHPEGQYLEDLVRVPWHSYQETSRRRIVDEPGVDAGNTIEQQEIQNQLEALGYRT